MAVPRSHGPEDRYPPLHPSAGRNSIRILALQPAQFDDDDIICRLLVTNIPDSRFLEDVVPYDALSYAFGIDKPTHTVWVEAWNVLVRENLWHGLHQLRHSTEEKFLWVDSLCINLHDAHERATQVQMMDQIYRGARRVLVWLGKGDEDSAAAMDIIQESTTTTLELMEVSILGRQALMNWANRPYWNRTWVVQEFLLARDIQMYCGKDKLNWYTVESFLRRVNREATHGDESERRDWLAFLETPAARLIQQRCRSNDHKAPLKTLLIRNRETECYDPRDKIYAMLGLSNDFTIGSSIRVSYTIDTRSLLFEVIQHCSVAARDVLRWARFLIDVLRIDRNRMQRGINLEHQQRISEEHNLTICGFITGKIIRCGVINDRLELEGHPSLQNSSAQERLSISEALRDTDDSDIARLKSSLTALNAPAIQHSGSPTFFTRNEILGNEQQMSWAVVLLSGCTNQQILTGLACGKVEEGSAVVQFLGNDIAVAMDAGAQSREVCGCLLFPKSNASDNESRDVVTQNICRRQTLQSEADCVESVVRVNLQMQHYEILALAQ